MINSMRKTVFTVLLLSLFIALSYSAVVLNAERGFLVDSKVMLPLNGSKLEVKLPPKENGRFMLKIKHLSDKRFVKKVFLNELELAPFKVKMKEIETDSFNIILGNSGAVNNLRVEFGSNYPKDIDLRLSNYLIFPLEALSYDLFILYRQNTVYNISLFLRFLSVLALSFGYFSLVFFILSRRREGALRYIVKASLPGIIFLLIIIGGNLAPFNPYQAKISSFFFLTLFSLVFFLRLFFILPEESGKKG